MSQAVARLQAVEVWRTRAMSSYALLVGAIGGAVVVAVAPFLAGLFGNRLAAPLIRLLAIQIACGPMLGVLLGIARRLGRFKLVAVLTLITNILGLGLGVIAVLIFRNAESLVVSTISSTLALTVCLAVRFRPFIGISRLRKARDMLRFSNAVLGLAVVQTIIMNLPRIATSNVLGATSVGSWNRAEVLSAVPLQQLESSIVPIVYPEFRHDRADPQKAARRWTDLLLLVALITVPLGIAGAVLLPFALPVVLGQRWHFAGRLAAILAVGGGVQAPTDTLFAALEATGRFRLVRAGQSAAFGCYVAVSLLVIAYHSVVPAVFGPLSASVALHMVLGIGARRAGAIEGQRLLRGYAWILALSITGAAAVAMLELGLFAHAAPSILVPAGAALAVGELGAIWRWRDSVDPIALLMSHLLRPSPDV